MSPRFAMVILLLPLCTASSQLFEQHQAELGRLPFRMYGMWRSVGNTKQKRNSGAVELSNADMFASSDFTGFNTLIYDEDIEDFEERNNHISIFWRTFLGYPPNMANILTFPGYGYVDRREKRVIIINRDAETMDAFKLFNPRDINFEKFENETKSFRDSSNAIFNPLLSFKRSGEQYSQCKFVLRLELEEVERGDAFNAQFKAKGKLVSHKCNVELDLVLDNTSAKFGDATKSFGIVVALLYIVQFTAITLQFLYGWRTHKTFAVSMPTVILLLFLSFHLTAAISTLAMVVRFMKVWLIIPAVALGLCTVAYAIWLVMIWMERRKTSTKEWVAESVVMLAAIFVAFFISYLVIRFVPGGIQFVTFSMYAFFVPQILSSRKSVHSAAAIHPMFAITTVFINSAIPLYLWLKSPNFMNVQYNPILASALASFLATQAAFLVAQFEHRREAALDEFSSITE